MCVINITLNTTTGDPNATIISSIGRYRIESRNFWQNFTIDLNNPKTPNITKLGSYILEVRVTNSLGITSDWASSSFQVSSKCYDLIDVDQPFH